MCVKDREWLLQRECLLRARLYFYYDHFFCLRDEFVKSVILLNYLWLLFHFLGIPEIS